MNKSVTTNQKARVILSDDTRPAADRIETILSIEGNSLKPNQGEMARWLDSHFSTSVAKAYWRRLCDKYWDSNPSYGKALHS